jgi:hypothetical protein
MIRARDAVAPLVLVAAAFVAHGTLLAEQPHPGVRGPRTVEEITQRYRDAVGAEVGQCLSGDPAELTSVVTIVDCAGPHLAEVVAEVTHPGDGRSGYPSNLAWSAFFTAACNEATSALLGRTVAGSTDYFNDGLVPTPEQWRVDDDRRVLCTLEVAYRPDGSRDPLTAAVALAATGDPAAQEAVGDR